MTSSSPFPPHLPDERGQRSRDRVLLYTRGMEISPGESVELARECLRRAGGRASGAEAMDILRGLLIERGLAHGALDEKGRRLLSAPPMNRRPMIVEHLDRAPWLTALRHGLNRLLHPFGGKTRKQD